nr:alpha amylase N-terminal ig-like domain-containing protein [Thermoclostridium stercorarium]
MDMKIHDWKESIYSDGSEYFVSNPNPALGENVLIKLRVFKWAPVKAVVLRYIKNGGDMHIKMEEIEEKGIFKYYGCEIKVSQPEIHYHFLIGTDSETYYYTQLGLTDYSPAEEYDFRIIADYECLNGLKNQYSITFSPIASITAILKTTLRTMSISLTAIRRLRRNGMKNRANMKKVFALTFSAAILKE